MSHGRPSSPPVEPSLTPDEGWHCSHFYYQFDRAMIADTDPHEIVRGVEEVVAILDGEGDHRPERLQVFIVSGHKADFGLMMMDPDPLKLDAVHQKLMASQLGVAIEPTYSFVSVSEVSEYVPSVEEYAERLVAEGTEEGGQMYEAKVKAYREREPMMRRQRLTPDFPDWPAMCFYPMNKKRKVGENWFSLTKDERKRMMSEHARSGMAFAGRVTQLITVSVGLDDWEWGVTLWAKNPQFLKDIVYRMRFDEASARFAEFGAFYTGYVTTGEDMLRHCQLLP